MTRKPLGKSGISVAPIALGGNVFGWTADEASSFAVLDAFVDSGFDLVDTANVYSAWVPGHRGGESEAIIGRWFRSSGKRDRVVLATKVGMQMGDGTKGLKKENILRSVEDSLGRLQTDRIDLYQAHRDDPEAPLEETHAAFDSLVRAGKVRAIGASNYDAARLAASLKVSRDNGLAAYVALQPDYNLYSREGFERELEPLCLKEGIGVIGYFSLAAGFLTGKYRSAEDLGKSARGKGVGQKYLNERGFKILAALDAVAAAKGSTPAVVALAWLIARPSVTAPIASATTPQQWSELARAATLSLSAQDVATLDAASAY